MPSNSSIVSTSSLLSLLSSTLLKAIVIAQLLLVGGASGYNSKNYDLNVSSNREGDIGCDWTLALWLAFLNRLLYLEVIGARRLGGILGSYNNKKYALI
ncbi:hypothetical protein GQ44DRAFT_783613 [Phaeosphaeriaceae sp. PMI808]|nr:hypothetical protein GQ44DRAFT_783613 [Phaeosphaeriaceae sp. PMI808]